LARSASFPETFSYPAIVIRWKEMDPSIAIAQIYIQTLRRVDEGIQVLQMPSCDR